MMRSGSSVGRGEGRRILLVLAAAHFLATADRSMAAVFGPLLSREVGLDDAALGVLLGPAFALIYAPGALIGGRWPARSMLIGCVAIWTLGHLIFALGSSFGTLALGRLVLGLGQAAFAPTALAVIAASFASEQQGRATSVFTSGSATGRSGALLLGGALLALAAGWGLAALSPWRVAVLAFAVPNLVVLGLLAAWIPQGVASVQDGGLRQGLRRLVDRSSGLAPLALAGGFSVLMVQAGAAWAPSLLTRATSLDAASGALTAGWIVLVAAPVGHLAAGWLTDRFGVRGPRLTVAIGVTLALSGAALMSLNGLAVLLGYALLTAGAGASAVACLAAVIVRAPTETRRSVTALYMTLTGVVGSALGPFLTGVISEALGSGERLGDALLLVVGAGGSAAIGVLLLFGRAGGRPAP